MAFRDRFKEFRFRGEYDCMDGFVCTSKGNITPMSNGIVLLSSGEYIASHSKDWSVEFINQLMLDGKLSKNQVRDLYGYPEVFEETPEHFEKQLDKIKEILEELLEDFVEEPASNVEKHKDICAELTDVYAKKNADYGDSFSDSLDKRGIVAALVRMEDKMNRLDSVTKSGEKLVDDETLVDTVMDLANYAIMTAMWLDSKLEFDEKK